MLKFTKKGLLDIHTGDGYWIVNRIDEDFFSVNIAHKGYYNKLLWSHEANHFKHQTKRQIAQIKKKYRCKFIHLYYKIKKVWYHIKNRYQIMVLTQYQKDRILRLRFEGNNVKSIQKETGLLHYQIMAVLYHYKATRKGFVSILFHDLERRRRKNEHI